MLYLYSIPLKMERYEEEKSMGNQVHRYRFDEDVLQEMENFKNDFLANRYRKDTSENNGPNYREKLLSEDQNVFEEYLNDADSVDFLNLE